MITPNLRNVPIPSHHHLPVGSLGLKSKKVRKVRSVKIFFQENPDTVVQASIHLHKRPNLKVYFFSLSWSLFDRAGQRHYWKTNSIQ